MNRRNIGMIACTLALVAMVQFTSAGYRVEDEAQQIAEEALWLLDQRDFGRLYEEFMSEEFRQTVAVEDFVRRFDDILGRIGHPRPDSRRLQQVDHANALPESSSQGEYLVLRFLTVRRVGKVHEDVYLVEALAEGRGSRRPGDPARRWQVAGIWINPAY